MDLFLQFKNLTMSCVRTIESWTYQGFITHVDMSFYHQNYRETGLLKGPLLCDGYGVFSNGKCFGLLEVYVIENGIEIGLAINPSYVGKGLSKTFIHKSIMFIINHYTYDKPYIYLSVDRENHQAYQAYLKAGFITYKETASDFFMRFDMSKIGDVG